MSLTLTWSGSARAVSYEYCVDTTNDASCGGRWISAGTSTSVMLSGLSDVTTYYWHVRAVNAAGTTYADGDTWWSFTTQLPPRAFVKTGPANGAAVQEAAVTITWQASVAATGYELCVDRTDNDACDENWVSVGNVTGTSASGLEPGFAHYWQVRATNAGGATSADDGAWWHFTPTRAPDLAKLTPADGAASQPTTLTLTWEASNGAIGYEYCVRSQGYCGVWDRISAARSTSASVGGLDFGTTYYWQVWSVADYGPIVCAGPSLLTPPEGFFTQVSTSQHTCAVRLDGTVKCWGEAGDSHNEYGQATPPEGTFTQVSAGWEHTCGVRTDGSVACWGDDMKGEATPPAGTFRQVSAGYDHTCGVRADNTVACWGCDHIGESTPPRGTFTQVSAGESYTCGVRTDGTVACWGRGTANTGVNWDFGQAMPPAGTFTQVSAGWFHSCGVRTDGTVACWGHPGDGATTPPDGTFTQVSAGDYHTCGVRTDMTAACWGSNVVFQAPAQWRRPFADVSAGTHRTCLVEGSALMADRGIWYGFTTQVEAPAAFNKSVPWNEAADVSTSVRLGWDSSTRATSYEYCFDTTNDGACGGRWTSTGTSTSVWLNRLSYGTTYYWEVRAVNAGGTTSASGDMWWSFTTQLPWILGWVTTETGVGISGVVMNGLPGSPSTDPWGRYRATVSEGWSGTVTPTSDCYTFVPLSTTYSSVTANQTTDYTGTVGPRTVIGTVSTEGGVGISGVVLNGLPGSPSTDASGNYSATVSCGWFGTVTPAKGGYTFVPSSTTYSSVVANQITHYKGDFAPTRIMELTGNLAFGNVTVGTTATRTLTITNSGSSALAASGITYPAGFSGAWSGMVAAGGTQNVTVTFAPGAVQGYSGMVTVTSDKTSGTDTIAASGTGTAVTPVTPVITELTPGSGAIGSGVTVTGTGFTGATAVTFNGVAAAYTVESDTQITTTVPAGTTTGPVRVTTPGGTATSAADFVVTNQRATRLLPGCYVAGHGVSVSVDVGPAQVVLVQAFEDSPPAGWTVGTISDGGVWDAPASQVKWGPFFDTAARVLTYVVTPPADTTGTVTFAGVASFDGVEVPLGGMATLSRCEHHPADANGDFRVVIGEVTGYGAAWKKGDAWAVPPASIPIGYVTRAGYLWRMGETYRRDAGDGPMCWVPETPAPLSSPDALLSFEDILAPRGGPWSAEASTSSDPWSPESLGAGDPGIAVRQSPATYVPAVPFTVTLTVTPSGDVQTWALEETVPAGWLVSAVSADGYWDEKAGMVRWGPFFDETPQTLHYTLTPPAGAAGSQALRGTASFDGVDVAVTGVRALQRAPITRPGEPGGPAATASASRLSARGGGERM